MQLSIQALDLDPQQTAAATAHENLLTEVHDIGCEHLAELQRRGGLELLLVAAFTLLVLLGLAVAAANY